MKTRLKLVGVIAFAAIMAFSFVACEDSPKVPKMVDFTIYGFQGKAAADTTVSGVTLVKVSFEDGKDGAVGKLKMEKTPITGVVKKDSYNAVFSVEQTGDSYIVLKDTEAKFFAEGKLATVLDLNTLITNITNAQNAYNTSETARTGYLTDNGGTVAKIKEAGKEGIYNGYVSDVASKKAALENAKKALMNKVPKLTLPAAVNANEFDAVVANLLETLNK